MSKAKVKKKTVAKNKKASKAAARQVLYANIAKPNRTWVTAQAKKAGVSQSMFTDAMIQFAKKNKFTFTYTGR